MSKSTLAVIAALSAGTGAAVTAAVFSLGGGRKPADKSTTAAAAAAVPATTTARPPPRPLPATPAAKATPTPATPGPVDPAGLFRYGFPGPVSDIATRSALVSAYDRRLRNPHWVAEHITAASLAVRDGDRQNSVFVEDEVVPAAFRAQLRDYFRSGYDRGHQVPAADCRWSQQAMDETFFLSNMCPQVGAGFNRDYWAHLEDFVRRLTARYASVRVVTGPLYLPKRDPADGKWYVRYEMIGSPAPSVAVPTHFYKVIYGEATSNPSDDAPVALAAFVLPNAPIPNTTPLADFEVPLDMVERAAGLEFAANLPPARRRRLCAETPCALVVRQYGDRQRAFAKNAAAPAAAAPSPRQQ